MYSYKVFNLCIHSEVELPELIPHTGSPDVTLKIENPPRSGILGEPSDQCTFGRVKNLINFVVEKGNRIAVIPNPKRSEAPDSIVRLIFGVLIGAVLQQRGYLVLHGATVAKDGVAVSFLGDSGYGKSTTAEFFLQNGYSLVEDDLLVVDVSEGKPLVLSGMPRLRLRPDAGTYLRNDFLELPLVNEFEEKRFVVRPINEAGTGSYPLAKIYVLEKSWAKINTIQQIGSHEGLLKLVANSYLAKFDLLPEQKARNLRQCTTLFKGVPLALLKRIGSIGALPDIFSLVEADLVESLVA